jgi:hypothetical protein
MSKRKITIEIEVESMGIYDCVHLKEFTIKLQSAISDVVQIQTKKWNRFAGSKVCLTLSSNKNETV